MPDQIVLLFLEASLYSSNILTHIVTIINNILRFWTNPPIE